MKEHVVRVLFTTPLKGIDIAKAVISVVEQRKTRKRPVFPYCVESPRETGCRVGQDIAKGFPDLYRLTVEPAQRGAFQDAATYDEIVVVGGRGGASFQTDVTIEVQNFANHLRKELRM
jgi:hypothetical protein